MIKHAMVAVSMAALVAGCSPSAPAEGQLPLSKGNNRVWKLVAMSNGPSFHVACHDGNKIYLLDSYFHRESEFHLTSPKTIGIVRGGC